MTWIREDWDHFYVDDELLPGRVKKCDVEPSRAIEQVKEDGVDTPNTKDNGYNGAVVNLELELFREQQAAELGAVLARISPRQAGGLASPHTVFHPITNAANVIRVYVEKYKLSMPERGRMVIAFVMHEWFPEGKKKKTSQGGAPKAGSGAVQSGQAAGDGGGFGNASTPEPDPANVGAKFA